MKKSQRRAAAAILGVLVAVVLVVTVGSRFFSSPDKAPTAATSGPAAQPAPGKVTMIDLGATECIPCKMMAPILIELKKEYAGRADIIFIDVWKNPSPAKKYGIRAIPTQIFFDADGREVHRHTGFMDKQSIVSVLTRLGVP